MTIRRALPTVPVVLCLAASAQADPLPDTTGDRVPVAIRSASVPLDVDVYPRDANVRRDRPVSSCSTPCELTLPRGRYRLFVHRTPDTLAGGRGLDVEDPVTLTLSPKGPAQRNIGLTLAIVGSVAMVLGAGMAIAGVDVEKEPGRAAAAGGLLFGGAALTAIGWVSFGLGRRPGLSMQPHGSSPSTPEPRRETSGGPWLALRGSF